MPLKLSHDELPALNLTSMIDVLFLLIIFFMVGTKFAEDERQIELQLPRVGETGAMTAAPSKKIVNVYPDGQVTFERQVVTLEELTQRLAEARRQYQGLGVLVRGDAKCPFQQVASVLAACRKAGVADVGITVHAAAENRNVRR